MSRPAWVAIIVAIAFPSIAMIVVLLVGPPGPPPPLPPPPGDRPRVGPWPPMPTKGPPPMQDEMLIDLRPQLGLSDEQVERLRAIGGPARQRMEELGAQLRVKEAALREALEPPAGEAADESAVTARLVELSSLRLEMDKVVVLTPLRLREVLTPEQRLKLVDLWRRRGPGGPSPLDAPPPRPDRGGPPPLDRPPPFAEPPPPPPPLAP